MEWKCARDVVCVWTDGETDREDDLWTRDSLGTTESHAAYLGWRLETFSIQVRRQGSHSDLAVFTQGLLRLSRLVFTPNLNSFIHLLESVVY